MAEKGEYELLPHEELENLRKEIDLLKQDPLHATTQADELKNSVDRLTVTLNKFITLMARTNDDMLDQFQQTSFIEQFARVNANQEQIAKGIVSVAKLLKQQAPATAQVQPQQPVAPAMQPSMAQPPAVAQGMQQPITPDPFASTIPPAPSQDFPAVPPRQAVPLSEPQIPPIVPPASVPPLPATSMPPTDVPPVQSEPAPVPGTSQGLPPPPPHKKGLFHFGHQ